jgi:hypothetical protein
MRLLLGVLAFASISTQSFVYAVPAKKATKPDWTLQKRFKGKWQGIKDGREGVLFEPTSPKEGTASFFYDGNGYETTPYRIEGKNRLKRTKRNVVYTFRV